ncbi:MAG TPA: DNA polymerase III subunit gamma/tau [Candidatus Babeliales bacterium]|nr:DNA polymerase III subunit gamma/tau [Candidatus Babeliales bacterium]
MDLNLTRKWRSRTFDGIVGQSLVVRMLKNSLYLDRYFPVYLFSGQRGCGKTTTARIFSAAVNCEQLPNFQKDPRNRAIPCLSCESCVALFESRHPDFIEIDAASHTGVDNVRQIIEAASLLPLLGRKKIYLIDEAHMLSKAAFNAFLKILEEPPRSVLFILATTDPHKIIDTVRSRCFQVFFGPVAMPEVVDHLKDLCAKESIAYEDEALALIGTHTEGSVRDAINLLERVRFSHASVGKQAVLDVLGYIDDTQLIELMKAVLSESSEQVISWFEMNKVQDRSAPALWDSFIELLRALLWAHNGKTIERYLPLAQEVTALSKQCSLPFISQALELFYDHELLFLKTTSQHRLFESLIMALCLRTHEKQSSTSGSASKPTIKHSAVKPVTISAQSTPKDNTAVVVENSLAQPAQSAQETPKIDNRWHTVVLAIEKLDDPLLISLFKQARFISFEQESGKLEVAFGKDFIFFQERIENTKAVWKPIIELSFGAQVQFHPSFIDHSVEIAAPKPVAPKQPMPTAQQSARPQAAPQSAAPQNQWQQRRNSYEKKTVKPTERVKPFDVSDREQWKKAHRILETFPGIISEVQQ